MRRIVVLDQDIGGDRIAAKIRDDHPVQVTVARDARQAAEELTKGDVALVVVDFEAPHKAGVTLLEWMEKRQLETPVLIGTLNGETSKVLGEFPDLVKIFESKPIALGRLKEMVRLYAED
jgi:DNA-binding NtrC family response regulator